MYENSELRERDLLQRYRMHGDLEAREELIERFLPLVRSLASRYRGRGESFEDLVQVGAVGLIKAVDGFDLGRGCQLTTYAVPKIIGEIKRHFRDRMWSVHVPRPVLELNHRLTSLVEALTRELGRSPSVAELARAADAEEEDVIEALEAHKAYSASSLSSMCESDEGERDPLELLGTDDGGYEIAEGLSVITPALRALPERERVILHLRFFEGLTQSEIACAIGVSQMHVSRLLRQAISTVSDAVGSEQASGEIAL